MVGYLKTILIFIMCALYMAATAIFVVAPEYNLFTIWMFAIAVSISIGFCIWFHRELILFLRTSFFKNFLSNMISLFLIFCIIGIINFLILKNDIVVDITSQKIHTLSEQSIRAAKNLKGEQIIFKIFAKRDRWQKFTTLLELYKNINKNIQIEAIDIEKDPALVALYGVKENGTLVVEIDDQRFQTVAKNELAITNLILKITNPKKLKVYHAVGHNELSFSDKNNLGADFLKEKILNSNFHLSPFELSRRVPADANAVLIMNPQIDYLDEEIANLNIYLKNGGALFITMAPKFNGNMTPKFTKFLEDIGLRFINGIVLDRLASQQGSQPSTPVISNYAEHPILKNFEGRTLFPVSSFFELSENPKYTLRPIVATTPFPASWGEVSFDQVKSGRADYNEEVDFKGPLAIVWTGELNDSRIVISGSTAFVSNQFQGQSNNFNLFLNALSWVVKEDALVSLNRPQLKGNIIYISDIHVSIIFYFAILIFPFLLFVLGIIAYRKRLSR